MALGGLAAFLLKPHEPAHGGKTISQWLEIAQRLIAAREEQFKQKLFIMRSAADEKAFATANEAISLIGSKAVPVLLKKLESDDHLRRRAADPWNSLVIRVFPASWYPRLHIEEGTAFQNHQQALHGFRVIKTNGNSAVPRLKEFLAQPRLATNAAGCLAESECSAVLSGRYEELESRKAITSGT